MDIKKAGGPPGLVSQETPLWSWRRQGIDTGVGTQVSSGLSTYTESVFSNSLSLSFLICEVGIIINSSGKDKVRPENYLVGSQGKEIPGDPLPSGSQASGACGPLLLVLAQPPLIYSTAGLPCRGE